MELSEFKKIIDKHLIEFLDSKFIKLAPNSNKEILDIFNQLKIISSDGKRIRPYIAYLSYKASEGNDDIEIVKLLTFIEVFHLFCLIHDDIMDKADERHGVKTIHKFLAESSYQDYGNSQAILVGDLMLSWSFEILRKNCPSDIEAKSIQEIFQKMVDEVSLGQMLDLNLKKNKTATDKEIIQKMLLKTAGYSFINPFLIGAALAGNSDEEFYTDLGTHLGLAFQIQDDLIDIEGGQSGKTTFNDISEHQPTLISNYVLENGSHKQKELLNNKFGNNLDQEDKKVLKDMFRESGAIEFGQKQVDINIDKARKLIQDKNNPDHKAFLNLINIIQNRKN